MTQNTSSQCLPASRFRSELELRRERGSLSHKSDYLSVACQSSNWHPELYSNTKGFPLDFFSHSMKSLFLHQHLKLVTRRTKGKERPLTKTSGRCCPPKKQMNKWVAGRAVDLESAGLGKLSDFSVPLLSSSGKWDEDCNLNIKWDAIYATTFRITLIGLQKFDCYYFTQTIIL